MVADLFTNGAMYKRLNLRRSWLMAGQHTTCARANALSPVRGAFYTKDYAVCVFITFDLCSVERICAAVNELVIMIIAVGVLLFSVV